MSLVAEVIEAASQYRSVEWVALVMSWQKLQSLTSRSGFHRAAARRRPDPID
jgi:hypothetical protein